MLIATTVFENSFAKIIHYPEIETIAHIWFAETTQLLFGETYREQIQIFIDYCEKYNPIQLLFDMREGEFIIDNESRTWLQEVVYPLQRDSGIKRKAYVVSQEEVDTLSLSVKLTANEDPNQFFEFKYFAASEEALKWLSDEK